MTEEEDTTYDAFIETGKKIKIKTKAVSKRPEKYVEESFHLKRTLLPKLRLPNLDTPPMSVELEFSMAKKMLYETEERLARKQRNIDQKVAGLNKQWKSLRQKENSLKDEFRKFNKFLRANMDKRERAYKKLLFDRETNLRRTVDVNNLREQCKNLKCVVDNMKKQVSENFIYERFLQSVTEASVGEFKDPGDFLQKVEVLMDIKETIRQRQQSEMECLQDIVGYSIRYVGSKMAIVLNLTGSLPVSKTHFEETQHRRLKLEYLLTNIKSKLTEFLMNVLVHRNAIDVIYNQIRHRKDLPGDWRNDDYFFKLMVIGRTLDEYETIRNTLEENSKKKRPSFLRKQ